MVPFELTKDTPYLALSGELWSVFYEYFNRNWSCYKGFLLYLQCLLFQYHCCIVSEVKLTTTTTTHCGLVTPSGDITDLDDGLSDYLKQFWQLPPSCWQLLLSWKMLCGIDLRVISHEMSTI